MKLNLNIENVNYIKILYKDKNDFTHCIKAALKRLDEREIVACAKFDEDFFISTPQDVNINIACDNGLYQATATLKFISKEEPYIFFNIKSPEDIVYQQKREYFRVKISENALISYDINDKRKDIPCETYDLSGNGVRLILDEKYNLPEKYIISVGTLEERKNQLKVIEAMEQLPKEVGLVIVGRPRGEYGKRVLNCASGRVRVLTNAEFSDFPALYTGAVASVYLSVFEGFGIPVLESMCCDCPVVTSNVSSMPEAGGEAALYASPDDAAMVATHLNHLLEDEDFRQQTIEKGRTQRMKFAPEKVTADMIAVYRSLLDD